MKLKIWIRRIQEYAYNAAVWPILQAVGDVEDHGLCAVHPAATDHVQNLHAV
jgi:hypothetical protein